LKINLIRAHIKIYGRVQGVFFRSYTCDKANELGISGWVANESDGSVGIMAEGPDNQMEDFIAWCHSGPSTARVEKVEVQPEPYSGEFEGFSIRY
jgi:acylphosphatase